MEEYKLNAVFEEFKENYHKEGSFVEIIEWKNGEGIDILVNTNHEKRISVTWDEFNKIQKLALQLTEY